MTDFTALFVCTGNICRSPLAEHLFSAELAEEGVVYLSAGTAATAGQSMPEAALAEEKRLGLPRHEHRARLLTADLVRDADVVLGLTRSHRAAAVRLVPAAAGRSFTLREFARLALLAADDLGSGTAPAAPLAARWRRLVPAAAAQRGAGPLVGPEEDDVPDPYRRPEAAYRQATALIHRSLEGIAATLVR